MNPEHSIDLGGWGLAVASGMHEVFRFVTWVLVSGRVSFVKIHQTIHFGFVYLPVNVVLLQ